MNPYIKTIYRSILKHKSVYKAKAMRNGSIRISIISDPYEFTITYLEPIGVKEKSYES